MGERLPRRLAAILYADVAGYSRLTGEDEDATHRILSRYLDLIASTIDSHRGLVMHYAGDAVLAKFDAVVDAMSAAVAIQNELKTRNEDLPGERKVQFRIGVNMGDVIEDRGDIYGDGVNVAARLESLAEPGGICISGTVFDAIGQRLPIGYEYLGEHQVRNISDPVRVYRADLAPGEARRGVRLPPRRRVIAYVLLASALAAGTALVWMASWSPTEEPISEEQLAFPLSEKPSIAVLPFENLTGAQAHEHIADGISESIITALSKTRDMFVIARNSAFTYKDRAVKVQQVSRELGVRYVLEGSVQMAGERLRISAQLIDALEGQHLWAEQYDRDLENLLDVLDEITHEIAVALQVELTRGQQVRLWASGTDNHEAWGYVSRAIPLFWRFRKEDNARARALFEKAVAIDSDYAVAWTWLAGTHLMDAAEGWLPPGSESYRQAIELAHKALELDDSNPLVHALLGELHGHRGQFGKSIAALEKAVALGPSNALVHILMADNLQEAGRAEEAVRYAEKATRLEPYYPAPYLGILARAYHAAGRYEDALAAAELLLARSRKGEGNPQMALPALIFACLELGREAEARAYAKELYRLQPTLSLSGRANSQRLYEDRAGLERLWGLLRTTGVAPLRLSSPGEFRHTAVPVCRAGG